MVVILYSPHQQALKSTFPFPGKLNHGGGGGTCLWLSQDDEKGCLWLVYRLWVRVWGVRAFGGSNGKYPGKRNGNWAYMRCQKDDYQYYGPRFLVSFLPWIPQKDLLSLRPTVLLACLVRLFFHIVHIWEAQIQLSEGSIFCQIQALCRQVGEDLSCFGPAASALSIFPSTLPSSAAMAPMKARKHETCQFSGHRN